MGGTHTACHGAELQSSLINARPKRRSRWTIQMLMEKDQIFLHIYMSISFPSCKSFYSMKSILKGKNRSSNAHGMNKLCANCKIATFYIRYTISSWHILWVLKNLVSLHLEAAIATSCFGLQFHNLIFKKITEIKKIKKIILFMYLIVLTII
jgi:hypothetical protein